MGTLKVLYRDVDRTPYLFTLRHCARRYGLELEILRAGLGVGPWADRLESGDVDVIAENYWGDMVTFRARGVPFITFGSVVNTWTEKLLVHPSIRALDDLRGKKFAVRTPGPQELVPGAWLKDRGLAKDVEQVVHPEKQTGRWGHWRKVAENECQACFVSDLYAEAPLASGLREIPYEPFEFTGGNVTLTTTETLIHHRRADIQNLVNASFDATRVFKADPATVLKIMRDETLDLLREHLDIPNDEKLEKIYRILRNELSDIPVPTAAGIWNALRIRFDTSPELRTFNPLLMWDLSFAREALRSK